MRNTFNYIIVEDEPLQLENLTDMLGKRLDLVNQGGFYNAASAFQFLTQTERASIDILFLDVQMPGQSGFDLLGSIKNIADYPKVIIVSAHEEYALESYNYAVTDYVTKPVQENRLYRAVDKAIEEIKSTNYLKVNDKTVDYFILNVGKKEIKIHYDELIYCESKGNDVIYYTETSSYSTRESLKVREAELPANQFMRIQNSFIVNLDHLIGHEGFNKVILSSRRQKEPLEIQIGGRKFREVFKAWWDTNRV